MKENQKPTKKLPIKDKKLRIYILVGLLAFILALVKIGLDVFISNVKVEQETFINVSSRKDMDEFLGKLEYSNYLNNFVSFKRLANWVQLENKMKPGRYQLKKGMSNFDILKLLMQGRQVPIDLVFKSAERIENVCGFFGRKLEPDSLSFLDLLKDTSIIHPMGFDTNTIIAMFIPNTYNFYWNTHRLAFLNRMHAEYKKFWNAQRLSKALQMHLSKNEISTLASIVQKESNKSDEMPIIAGVYLNRLKLGMPLQADPTVIFAWHDPSIRRVLSVHTALESPYNTYMVKGLPPGPICAPSIQAIDAVLNYAEHNYIYFCAREDFSGYHSFATTFAQHQVNARRYQRSMDHRP
jgi:UPF0755 protein